jgi:hypothetical protein
MAAVITYVCIMCEVLFVRRVQTWRQCESMKLNPKHLTKKHHYFFLYCFKICLLLFPVTGCDVE